MCCVEVLHFEGLTVSLWRQLVSNPEEILLRSNVFCSLEGYTQIVGSRYQRQK